MNVAFPTTIVDGFFENPDTVVDFANTLSFEADPDGAWPGVRSKNLMDIDRGLFEYIGRRIFGIYYDMKKENLHFSFDMYFQKVFSKYKQGWAHRDAAQISCIIFLNKKYNLDSGTSICRLKDHTLEIPPIDNGVKQAFYKGFVDSDDAQRIEHNNFYEDTIIVKNVYNRLLIFDSSFVHRAQEFSYVDEDRLTLAIFGHGIIGPITPISRMKVT